MTIPIRRSLAFSFLESYSVMALSLVSVMILARILTPEEIGVFSVGAVVVGMAQLLRDFGVGQFLTQVRDLTVERLRAALALQMATSALLASLLFVASAPLAAFYEREELRTMVPLLALNLLLIPFSSILLIWYRREFQYRASFIVSLAGTAAGLVVSTAAAVAGFGYLSLVWGSLTTSVATIIVANLMRPAWFPWLPSMKGVREMLAFGGYASASSVAQEASPAARDLVVGKVVGVADVAIFGKAMGVVGIFTGLVMKAVWAISTPTFAKQRHGGEDPVAAYSKAVSYLTALSWPFFAFIAVMAFPVVRVLFGSQWDAAVPLVRILSLHGGISVAYGLVGSLLTAHGRVKEHFQLNVVSSVLGVAVLLIAVQYGLQAVAIGAIGTAAFTLLYTSWMLKRVLGLPYRLLFGSMVPSLPIAIVVALVTTGVLALHPDGWHASVWTLIPAAAAAVVAWVVTIVAFKHPITSEMVAIGRLLRPARLRRN